MREGAPAALAPVWVLGALAETTVSGGAAAPVSPFPGLRMGLIEQKLLAGGDDALAGLGSAIPIGADESCRTVADLERLGGKYAGVVVKLDKAGGLTEALALAAEAKRMRVLVMVGGGISTSLGGAPTVGVAQGADVVDLDGPLRLAMDRGRGMRAV